MNILLAILFFLILRQLAPLLLSAQESGVYDTKKIIERLHTGTPAIRLLLSAFCVLWLYSWIDAAVGEKRTGIMV